MIIYRVQKISRCTIIIKHDTTRNMSSRLFCIKSVKYKTDLLRTSNEEITLNGNNTYTHKNYHIRPGLYDFLYVACNRSAINKNGREKLDNVKIEDQQRELING